MLLIDTDSQSHATLVTTGRDDFDTTNSLYSVLMADRQIAPQVMAIAGMTVSDEAAGTASRA